MSWNESLPWSDDLIIRFAEKWVWNTIDNDQGFCLMNNPDIEWLKKITYMFPDKFFGSKQATDTDLLNKYPEILWEFRDKL